MSVGNGTKDQAGNNIDQRNQQRKDNHHGDFYANELLTAPAINDILAMGFKIKLIHHQHDDDHTREI